MANKKKVDIDRVFHGTQGIKPQGTDEWIDFDEDNSEYSESQMKGYLKRNSDMLEGRSVELEMSPNGEDFVGIDANPGSNRSKGSGKGYSGNGNDQDRESIERQKAFAEVREWWSEHVDPSEMDVKDYQKFFAMVRDAAEFIGDGEFNAASHFLMNQVNEGEVDIPDEAQKVLREMQNSEDESESSEEPSDEGGPSEEDVAEETNESEESDQEPAEDESEEKDGVDEEPEAEDEQEETEEREAEDNSGEVDEEPEGLDRDELETNEDGDPVIFGDGDEPEEDESEAEDLQKEMEELVDEDEKSEE